MALPVYAQFSPMYGTVVADVNGDGNLDIIGVGNSYASPSLFGWYDAGNGVSLLGNGKGNFINMPAYKSGFCVQTDAKALATLSNSKNEMLLISTSNRDSLKIFKTNIKNSYPDNLKSKRKHEVYLGAGYLSQSDSHQ